eukprot:3607820-Pyramimonas_sp.AAC.1
MCPTLHKKRLKSTTEWRRISLQQHCVTNPRCPTEQSVAGVVRLSFVSSQRQEKHRKNNLQLALESALLISLFNEIEFCTSEG